MLLKLGTFTKKKNCVPENMISPWVNGTGFWGFPSAYGMFPSVLTQI
jgi:hypothetical protein